MTKSKKKDLVPISIKVDRDLKAKLVKLADSQHRSLQGQTVFFIEQGLRVT